MGDRWAGQQPPEEAYSRVSRDLAEVTAEFRDFLDALPTRLEAEFECSIRPATPAELDRLSNTRGSLDIIDGLAVGSASEDCATLLISSPLVDGGSMAVVAFGWAMSDIFPVCFCDACDEDSESLIEQTNEYVKGATLGCREFRETYVSDKGDALHNGPWLQHGFETPDGGGQSSASADVRGDVFSRVWQPWPRRTLNPL